MVLILSSGGLAFTLFQHPTKTHSEAVAMMFRLVGTGSTVEAQASRSSASNAFEAGFLSLLSLPSTAGTEPG